MLRTLLAVLVVLMLGAGTAGAYWKFVMEPERQAAAGGPVPGGGRGGGARGPTPVEAAEVRIGPVEVTTEAVGSLLSNEAVVIRPEVTGRVAAINFDEGAPVKAGQVIVELDAAVERAQLAQAEADLGLGTANFERAKELRRSNVGTQRALDEAQAQLRTAEAAIQLAKARLSKLTLTAPFDAVAGLRRVSVGDFVTAGTDIVGLEQIKPLKVDFAIPEIFLRSVREGQRIAFTVDAFPGEAFEGVVFAVSPLVSEAGRAVTLRARIDNTDVRLRPGLFARVTLTLSQQPDGVWTAEEAIVPEGGRQFVFKVADGGAGKPKVARKTEVKLGLRRQGEVQVASGLAPGDIVVTGGVGKIRDDAPVAVQQQSLPGPAQPPAPATAANPAP
ncbi:MAG TPA: efflux RND transporter periplasmic adaptor subunit, partial [Geminicoccaceae bacterium]